MLPHHTHIPEANKSTAFHIASMCLYTSVICINCHLEFRIKKTDYCIEVQDRYDQHGEDWHCAKIAFDHERPFTKACKGDICAACRCRSEAEAEAEECDVSLEDGQSMNRNMRKKTRSGKRGDKRETKA